MRKKRWLALGLAAVMSLSMLAGCGDKSGSDGDTTGGGDGDKTTEDVENNGGGDNTEDVGTAGNDEVVSLKWVAVGGGMPNNYDAWKEKVDAYLGEKIGVNIDMEIVSWDAWANRRGVIANSGEEFDILFTDTTTYNNEVSTGIFMDITELVKTAAPDLYAMIPEDYWEAVSIDGKVYSVPTYKDSSATSYYIWDADMAEKYDIDITKVTDLESLYEALKTIKDGEGGSPWYMTKDGLALQGYDNLGVGLAPLGVAYTDETRTVVNPFEQQEVMDDYKLIHKMYSEGIINGDAPTIGGEPGYRTFFVGQGWSGAAKTSWGPNNGIANCEAVPFTDTIVANATVRGSLNGISAGCKNPEKALAFLELLNTDSYLRDLFYYGLEGDQWEYTDDNKVHVLKEGDWTMAGYTQATFFNVSPRDTVDFNEWDEVKELNANATPSVMLGFTMDTSKVQTEVANCSAVFEKYQAELYTGAQDPEVLIPKLVEELKAAGWQTIADEAQNQINEYYGQ